MRRCFGEDGGFREQTRNNAFMHAKSHCGQRIHHNPAIGIERIQFVGWHGIAKGGSRL
jgi:hypothetical protein